MARGSLSRGDLTLSARSAETGSTMPTMSMAGTTKTRRGMDGPSSSESGDGRARVKPRWTATGWVGAPQRVGRSGTAGSVAGFREIVVLLSREGVRRRRKRWTG